MPRKVLIVAYYWPPAGGPGVQRWLKFVKYLPDYGIEPIVYCPENPSYPIIDEKLASEIPESVKVIKQPINEPYKYAGFLSSKDTKTISSGVIPKKKKQSFMQRFLLFVRGNFFIPDARKNWIKPSVHFLDTYLTENKINTIITTGPPHSMHLIGYNLKQKLNIKWIADFRDPWTTIGYHKEMKLTNRSRKRHVQLEQEVLNTADHIVVTSPYTKTEFSNKTKRPISVITNGYDDHNIKIDQKDKLFSLSHIGSLLSERNPEALWQALSELINEVDDFKACLKLNFIGVASDDVIESVYRYGLKSYLDVKGYLPHEEAIKAQMASQVLLLIEIDSEDTKAIIPGKLFEYMVSETPILAIGPKDSDIKAIITSTNTGVYYTYENKEALKSQILMYFEAYKSKNLRAHGVGLKPYSRRELTKQLAELL